MVFDWIANCRRIMSEGTLALGDKWERRMAWAQEVNFVRYLVYGEPGMGRDEAFAAWSSVRGGTAERLAYDPDALRLAFDGQLSKAKALGPLSPLPVVSVTDAEVAYVDGLSAPLEVKGYWLRLLVYLKTKRALGERTTSDRAAESYFMADAGIAGRPCDALATVARWSLRCGTPFRMSVSSGTPRYQMPGWAGRGSPVVECDLSDAGAPARLLGPKPFVCPECGARFSASGRRKTELCGACYERSKVARDREWRRAYRKKSDKN